MFFLPLSYFDHDAFKHRAVNVTGAPGRDDSTDGQSLHCKLGKRQLQNNLASWVIVILINGLTKVSNLNSNSLPDRYIYP